jgi:hypothetical protein
VSSVMRLQGSSCCNDEHNVEMEGWHGKCSCRPYVATNRKVLHTEGCIGGSFFMTYIFVQIQVYQDQLGGPRGLRIKIRDELVEKRP